MATQYDRLFDPFPSITKQDATSLADHLWRMEAPLNRIKGSLCPWYQRMWCTSTIEKIMKEREQLASDLDKWRNSRLYDGEKTIPLGAVQKAVYQLEDMADDIGYTRQKQHEAKFCRKLYITLKLRLVLKFRKTQDILHDLRGIIGNFQKEFSAKTRMAGITTELQDVISEDQSLDSSTDEISKAISRNPESDGPHSTTKGLLKSLFKARNCVLTYGPAQGTGSVTIPVQDIFKDQSVQKEFQLHVYVRASDKPISTLEASILEHINSGTVNKKVEQDSTPNKEGSSNLRQEEDEELIKTKVKSKIMENSGTVDIVGALNKKIEEEGKVVIKKSFESKILLVLENVLEDQLPELHHLLSSLSSGNTESRMVISCQSPELLKSLSGIKSFSHKQPDYSVIFWRFFRSFAFRAKNKEYPKEDQDQERLKKIGKRMSLHLNKFPLGAKMIGKMLSTKRDCHFWTTIEEKVHRVVNCKPEHDQLQSLLQICYDELPAPLRLCFQYCSLFPSNWAFTSESLVRLWMPQGFVVKDLKTEEFFDKDLKTEDLKTEDDVGKLYFAELHSRSFFEKLSDDGSLYSFHASVHGFAQVTAGKAFMRIESDILPKDAMGVHVRHLSVNSTNLAALYNLYALHSLRTLIIFGPINPAAPDFLEKILPGLRTTRTLDLSGCGIKRLPELTTDLRKHLRYLSLYDTGIEKLPRYFCKFLHLQVLNLLGCLLQKFPPHVTRLCNLRHIDGPTFLTSEMRHVGKFKALQELEEFPVSKTHKIQELGGIKDLRGSIAISNLEKVKSGNAAKAKLDHKRLESLKLEWSSTVMRRSSLCGCNILPDKSRVSAEVLDRLKPNSGLRVLEINWYIGGRPPSWFTKSVLANMVCMRLRNCINWKELPPLGQLPNLKTLQLEKWDQLYSFGGVFPMLEELSLEGMPELCSFHGWGESFRCLKLLIIRNCEKLDKMPLLESSVLTEICLEDVGLKNLPLPTINQVDPSTSSGADRESLTRLTIQNCPNLETVGAIFTGDSSHLPSSLLHLKITACEKAQPIGLKLPFTLQESQMTEITDLEAESFEGESPSLRLRTVHVDKVSLLEPHFDRLRNLEELVIEDAHLRSLEKFPSTLRRVLKKLSLLNCEELKALPEDMKQFSSLKSLRLKNCHKISSLPYLPYSLDELRVDDCPLLKKRYREDSVGWTMISHVPYKHIQARGSAFGAFSLLKMEQIKETSLPSVHSHALLF